MAEEQRDEEPCSRSVRASGVRATHDSNVSGSG